MAEADNIFFFVQKEDDEEEKMVFLSCPVVCGSRLALTHTARILLEIIFTA
jgi:hypothetical protein